MGTMESYVKQMDAQLKTSAVKIDEFMAKSQQVGANAKADVGKSIGELKAKHAAAQKKFDELKVAGANEWETFRLGVESAWAGFESDFKKLMN